MHRLHRRDGYRSLDLNPLFREILLLASSVLLQTWEFLAHALEGPKNEYEMTIGLGPSITAGRDRRHRGVSVQC